MVVKTHLDVTNGIHDINLYPLDIRQCGVMVPAVLNKHKVVLFGLLQFFNIRLNEVK